jgi:hypothetical protein
LLHNDCHCCLSRSCCMVAQMHHSLATRVRTRSIPRQ